MFKLREPLMAKKITIKKERTLTQEEVLKLLVDVTEYPIGRPKCLKNAKQPIRAKRKNTRQEQKNTLIGLSKVSSSRHLTFST
ncbi:MAG: hypothetical protein REH83_05805 [Rickettsiella sp.]|nr:hypothetical protein [Rickettsiella sp.]